MERDALALVSGSAGPDIRASQQSNASDSNIASSAQLHKQLLAAEVAKLRKEAATLRSQQNSTAPVGGVSDALKQARMEKERKEAEKAEVVAQANSQKQVLAGEVKSLRGEIQSLKGSVSNPLAAPGSPIKGGPVGVLPDNVAEALERRKAFEEQFSMTLRSLREELMDTSIKRLSGRSQTPQGVRALLVLSDERITRIMAEAAKVPVDERLHIEAVRLFIENCKFRKALNEYARALLVNTLVKDDAPSGSGSTFGIM